MCGDGSYETGALEVERYELSVGLDHQDRLGHPGIVIASHARRIRWHPRKGETNDIGTVGEQLHDGLGGHVAFNHISVDHCGVTRPGFERHPEVGLEFSYVRIFGEINFGPKFLQVPDPPMATSSAGRLMHDELDTVKSGGRDHDTR